MNRYRNSGEYSQERTCRRTIVAVGEVVRGALRSLMKLSSVKKFSGFFDVCVYFTLMPHVTVDPQNYA